MSEEGKSSRWFEVPKEVLEELGPPEGDDVEGFIQQFSYKVEAGGTAFLKLTTAPSVGAQKVSPVQYKRPG